MTLYPYYLGTYTQPHGRAYLDLYSHVGMYVGNGNTYLGSIYMDRTTYPSSSRNYSGVKADASSNRMKFI